MGVQVIYLKEQFGNAVFDRHGKVIPFHALGGDFGGIKLDSERDKETIEDLDGLIAKHTGGVYKSNDAEYEKKKEIPRWQPSASRSEPLRVFNPHRAKPAVPVAPAAEGSPAPQPSASVVRSAPIPFGDVVAQQLTQPAKAVESAGTVQVPADPAKPVIPKPRMGRAGQGKKAATAPTPATA